MIKSQITLEEALGKEFCPLCRLVREAEERMIWFILYESTGDPKLRAKWDKEKGFCKYHNTLIKLTITHGRLVSGSSIARIYETILDGYIRDLQELGRNSHSKNLLTNIKCFFCSEKEELESSNITLFIDYLASEKGHKMFRNSSGLCNPHLALALSRLTEKNNNVLRHFLVEDHLSKLEKLKNNITELQRKERYDIKQLTTDEEKNSWKEVLWRFSRVSYDHLLIWEKHSENRI